MDVAEDKPRPSRREARRNDRREAILAVAHSYFLEHGYAGTSMSGIAATIGGSKATLWSYFPSKEALFEAVLDHATTLFRQQLSPLLEGGGEPEAVLLGFARRFIEKVASPEAVALYRLVHAEVGRFPEIGAIFDQRGPRTTHRMLGGYLESAMERGLLRRSDPIVAARMLTAMCLAGYQQQMLLSCAEAPDSAMIAAYAEMVVELFLRAYAPD